MRSTKRWLVACTVALAMVSALPAATYYDGNVTAATLAEQDAVNILDGYTATSNNYQYVGAAAVGGVTFNVINGSTIASNNYFLGHGVGADNCVGLIDGSTFTATYWASVGAADSANPPSQGGDNNSLTIQNGGRLIANGTTNYQYNAIGAGGTTGNAMLVTGAGSLYRAYRILVMHGTGGTLTVENQGMTVVCRADNDGGITVGDTNYVRLANGYVVTGKNLISSEESRIQLWTGSEWAVLSSLDQTQRDALGYAKTQITSEAQFNALTGGLYTDVASTMDFNQANAVYLYAGGIPEPTTMALLSMGGLALLRRRRR